MANSLFYVLTILAMIFWGASWICVKVLSNYIDAYEVAFLRLFISVVVMTPVVHYMKLGFKIDIKSLFFALIASIILVVYSVCFYMGAKYGEAGLGGALVTTLIPINTFILLSVLQKKHLKLKQIVALFLGGFGVLTMLDIWQFDMNAILSQHNIYFLLASLLWPLLTITSSKALKISPLVFTLYVNIISTVILFAFFIDSSIILHSLEFDFVFWFNMFVISILSTAFATTIYFVGINKLGTKEVSSFIFLVPSSALILSAVFLGESISFNTILGTVCTLVAIYMLNNISLKFLLKH